MSPRSRTCKTPRRSGGAVSQLYHLGHRTRFLTAPTPDCSPDTSPEQRAFAPRPIIFPQVSSRERGTRHSAWPAWPAAASAPATRRPGWWSRRSAGSQRTRPAGSAPRSPAGPPWPPWRCAARVTATRLLGVRVGQSRHRRPGPGRPGRAPSGHRSRSSATRRITPSSTRIAVFSRSAAPVPSKSRAPVSQSRSAAGAGAAISAGNRCVTSLPPFLFFSRVPQTVVTHSATRPLVTGGCGRTALTAGWQAGTASAGRGDGAGGGRAGA